MSHPHPPSPEQFPFTMVDLLWASTPRTHGHRHRGGGLQAPCTQGRTTPSRHLSLKVEKLNFTAEETLKILDSII